MQVEPKYHRHFVARRGELLHEISDQYGGVTVSFPRSGVDSSRVVLKGIVTSLCPRGFFLTKFVLGAKECVEAAKSRIEEIVSDLEQQVSIDCIIPQKFHRTLMGSKGVRIQAITTEYDVKIKFPEKSVDGGEGAQPNGQAAEGETGPDGHKLCDIIRITGLLISLI